MSAKRLSRPAEEELSRRLRSYIQSGYLSGVVELLRDFDVDLSHYNEYGFTPLQLAASHGHLDVTSFLIDRGASLDSGTKAGGYTALHLASNFGHESTTKFLITAGSCVDRVSGFGTTALHRAAMNGHTAVVRELLMAGVSGDVKNEEGYTALHYAALENHIGAAKLLIAAGVRVDVMSNTGVTPLHLADHKNRTKMVTLLMTSGAVPFWNTIKETIVPSDHVSERVESYWRPKTVALQVPRLTILAAAAVPNA